MTASDDEDQTDQPKPETQILKIQSQIPIPENTHGSLLDELEE
jgi:hypothetical protein